jgi:spoIIIJ-associated protein
MEWVETTGKTVEEAKEHALDQLGVDEQDAEFDVLEEPRPGLFGRVRGEARVRARVRPTRPRPKVERRDRRRRQGRDASRTGGDRSSSGSPDEDGSRNEEVEPAMAAAAAAGATAATGSTRRRRRRGGRGRQGSEGAASEVVVRGGEGSDMSNDATVEEQAEIISEFLEGLVDAFGLDGEVSSEKIDDDTIEVQVNGNDLGLMIGPKGQTLQCIQELARTVVQRKATGTHHGRVRIDVGQYRQRRREALERFTRQVAEEVRSTGRQKALEAMGPADRKVVHDTANEIDGVSTISEGQEPRRRVVILPATAD